MSTKIQVPLVAVFWFFALGVPFTILAIVGVAYLDTHYSQIVESILRLEQMTTAGGRGWVAETAERLPELAGMIIGMIVMYTIYIFLREPARAQQKTRH